MVMDVSQKEQVYQNPSKAAIVGGAAVGSLVQSTVMAPKKLVAMAILNKMSQLSDNLSADEFEAVAEATGKILKDTKLAEKGVEIVKATGANSFKIKKNLIKEINGNKITKFIPKKLRHFITNLMYTTVESGNNAVYAFKSKKIIMPEKELSLAFFHEAGHAINANLSKFGKALQKIRPLTVLAVPIALIALWKTKKAEGEKPTGTIDKITTFVKDNAGKLTFATFLPMLLEEGLASIRAQKMAKTMFGKGSALAAKVAKTNAWGFSTYAITAVLSSVGIWLGAKVKDMIASRKAINTNNN